MGPEEIKSFQTVERKAFEESYRRSGLYMDMILAELRKEGLPEQLAWIPLIESSFKPRALSRARALGMWQFIRSTGYRYGLKQDKYVDERMDPVKATRAAIQYMIELHDMFGDWTTAIAAYNCGEAARPARHPGPEGRLFRQLLGHLRQPARSRRPGTCPGSSPPCSSSATRPSTASSCPPPTRRSQFDTDQGRRRRQAGHPVPEPRARSGRPGRPELRAAARLDAELPLRPPRPGRLRRPMPGLHRLPAPVHPARRRHRPATPSGPATPWAPSPAATGPRSTAIKRLNGLKSRTLIRVGQVLRVPSRGGVETPPAAAATAAQTGETVTYIVRERRQRSSRSPRPTGRPSRAIKAANSLASDILVRRPEARHPGRQILLTGRLPHPV
ncbi:MAG: transglycosylase SLT domain-containing protein [Ignavibacteriales bacterium]|nr:transglycosylase SLT domain-containing protein [Ignavibacteriales bacterium]